MDNIATQPHLRRFQKIRFFERKERWALTLWGKLCLGVSMVALFLIFVAAVHPFLAINVVIPSEARVVEGWVPDYALQEIVREFNEQGAKWLLTTGGPLEQGSFLSAYKTYAELARATLLALGVSPDAVTALPAPPVTKDRTYKSATVCKEWFEQKHPEIKQFTVYTVGPHARRTLVLFRKAFGPTYSIGVRALESESYDSKGWWRTSAGVRTVLSEFIAYLYGMIYSSLQR